MGDDEGEALPSEEHLRACVCVGRVCFPGVHINRARGAEPRSAPIIASDVFPVVFEHAIR